MLENHMQQSLDEKDGHNYDSMWYSATRINFIKSVYWYIDSVQLDHAEGG